MSKLLLLLWATFFSALLAMQYYEVTWFIKGPLILLLIMTRPDIASVKEILNWISSDKKKQ